jgi:uncharacterized protein (TIGR04141 family)
MENLPMADIPTRSLTIYLIKPDLEHASIIRKIKSRNYRNFEVGSQRYHVFAKKRSTRFPDWATFFEGWLTNDFVWKTDSPGVVLLLDVDGRTFALTFGQGRHLLEPDSYEDGFGLHVVLNTVEKVRSLDKRTFDAILGQTRTQASSYTDVGQFGFDWEKDLLRAVTGRPVDEQSFGQRISGVDALAAVVQVDLAGLPALLGRYLKQAGLEDYKKHFAFVDQMRAVSTKRIKDALNELLVSYLNDRIEQLKKRIAKKDFPFELVVPEVLDWSYTNAFAYGLNRAKEPARHDISIDTFLAHYSGKNGRSVNYDSLKRSPIYALDGSGFETHTWSAYKCLVGDMSLEKKKYVLSDGHWYQVDSDYVAELEEFISNIPPYEQVFPSYNGGDEKDYNINVAATMKGFYNFDRQLIHPITKQSIEFCDLYTENHGYRDLIHIKHGTSSAVLSHLFAQGTTSSDLCADFSKCKDEADKMVCDALGSTLSTNPTRPTTMRTVYGIIRRTRGSLPFFSKVNLRRACRDLNRMRLKYALAEIEYDPSYLIARA